MKKLRKVFSVAAAISIGLLAVVSTPVGTTYAASHREAPLTSGEPEIDTTDVYVFVSPDAPDTVTMIANWIPLQQPAAGPNFYNFDDDSIYELNIDSDGDARADLTYQFDFRTEVGNPNTFLYNTGPISSINDATLNVKQFYSVTRIRRAVVNGEIVRTATEVIAQDAQVAPANIGPRSTPDYDTLANQAIKTLGGGGGKVFAGPRDDPFFVDLGSAFDLLGLRPLNAAHAIPLENEPGVDGVAGYNVHTTAIQVPISTLQLENGVMGMWAVAKRPSMRMYDFGGDITTQGPLIQVSRLSAPLINEVIIPRSRKDDFNGSRPDVDGQFGSFVTNPEPVALINLLYGGAIPDDQEPPTSGRTDLVTVFLTGIPGVNQLPQVTPSEMMRLNTGIAPTANPNRLGVVGGDNAGFPNGRRLMDDVVDIELRALACSYGVVGTVGPCDSAKYNKAPNNALGDGVNANEKPFLTSFPYMAAPYQGYEAQPPMNMDAKATLGAAGTALAGLALVFVGWKRRQAAKKVA